MTPPHEVEVAVVGAGPAGSRTAEVLALQGHSVVLFERDETPGLPVHCTGIVSKDCFERYNLPGELIVRPISSFVLRSPSGRPMNVKRHQIQAYVLDRVALDKHLVSRATSAGAELLVSTEVQNVSWDGVGVAVTGMSAGSWFEVRARAAVIATGFGAPLARRLGLNHVRSLVIGSQVVVEAKEVDQVEVFTGGSLGEGGFGWMVPWRPGQALVGLLTRRHTVTFMRSLVARLRSEGKIGRVVDVYRTRAVPVGAPTRTVSDGLLGVGDVVSQVKPTSGGGIHYGLIGADMAAQTLSEALAVGDCSAVGLGRYEDRWRSLLETEIKQGVRLRRLLEQLPDSVIEQLHRMLSIPGLSRLLMAPSFDWHSGALTRVLSRLESQVKGFAQTR